MKNIKKLIVVNDILVKRCVEKGIGLTVGQEYQILAEGNYWYMVKDDNGLTVHFAKEHFAGGRVIELFSKYNMYGVAINCSKELLNEYSKYMKVLTEGRPSDITKLVAKFESHDDYLDLGLTKRMTDEMRLTEWNVLVNQLQGCDCLYYARPFETLWKSEEMRKINKGE